MAIVRPRLNDFYNIPLKQEDIDFALPFLDEDIPLYVDPFLLWKIPSQQDNGLHLAVVSAFNAIGNQFIKGKEQEAIQTLIDLTECDEAGLGNSKTRTGKKLGVKASEEILELFKNIPQIKNNGFEHFEEVQLLVEGISKDRISDITCSLIKSFLVDYTLEKCDKYKFPFEKCSVPIFNIQKLKIILEETYLPVNPDTQ